MRRIVCRAPWSAVAVTEQVLTTTRSACSGGAGARAAASSSPSIDERVGLVDAAAEGDDGVLHVRSIRGGVIP